VLQPLWPASTVIEPSVIELTCTLNGFVLPIEAATSADPSGYKLELGVPAEIVSEAADPACAWPEPVPPEVQAATATPITDAATTRATTAVSLFRFFANPSTCM
jgi:hypothetical protein